MQLILKHDVEHVGKAGELVTVKSGYARNYLMPQGLAALATTRNKAQLEHNRAVIAKRVAKELAEASGLADRLNGMTLQFQRLVGEDYKMFGSVTNRDICSQLEVAGVKLDHRKIQLGEPIREIGKHEIVIKLGSAVAATLRVNVVEKDK